MHPTAGWPCSSGGSHHGPRCSVSAALEGAILTATADRAEALAIPLDHGRRLHHHHGVQNPRPDSVQPHPQQPICGEELKASVALPPQDAHLMPKGDALKFQGGTTSNTASSAFAIAAAFSSRSRMDFRHSLKAALAACDCHCVPFMGTTHALRAPEVEGNVINFLAQLRAAQSSCDRVTNAINGYSSALSASAYGIRQFVCCEQLAKRKTLGLECVTGVPTQTTPYWEGPFHRPCSFDGTASCCQLPSDPRQWVAIGPVGAKKIMR